MDFSVDQTRLAVGFSTGALFIFDTNTKRNANKFIFKSNDVVQPGRGLIHLKYITRLFLEAFLFEFGFRFL